MILRNSILNFIGLGVPLLVAVFTIPYLIEALGVERFGLLTLVWAVVSYFGLFDLGLGRALTLQLSRYLASGRETEVGELVWTALLAMASLGVIAGVTMFLLAPLGLAEVESSVRFQEQAETVLYLAWALPFIVLTTAYRGILESKGLFFQINAIRIPMGMFTFIGPFLVVMYWQVDLGAIALVLFLGRVLGCVIHAVVVHKELPNLNVWPVFSIEQAKPLFSVGGWLTVSNIVSPFMGYVDRFLIGALITAAAVAYYATPNEIITKLWIIPGAVTAVLFPHFASNLLGGTSRVKASFFKAQLVLFVIMFPICLTLFSFSKELLTLWVGENFALESYVIFRWFCVGILINCMAHIPYTLIQSSGDTRRTAIIHLLELPLFVCLLYWLVTQYGGEGAAIAWCARMSVDAFLMYHYGLKVVGVSLRLMAIKSILWIVACSVCFSLSLILGPIVGGFLSVLATVFSGWTLFAVFRERRVDNEESKV